jgi:putative salt-induced outer membrane protein YdiY
MRRPLILLNILVLGITLLGAAPAAADEVLLTNGDRFTGTVVSLAGGTLLMDTAYGQVQIAWTSVASLTVADPILVTLGTAVPVEARIAPGGAASRILLDPGGTADLAQVVALARRQPALVVDGGANAGFITTGGNTDVTSLRFDTDAVVRHRENRYTASSAVNRVRDRGVLTAQNWTAGFNYDRFLTGRLFVNGNAILTNDRFRDLDLRTALGGGVGYQVLSAARARLTANAGVGFVNENFEAGVDDRYTALRESATFDLFLVPDRIAFFHQHDGYFGVTGEDNRFVRTRNGIRLGLVGGLVTTLQHDLDYDRSPAPGRRDIDRTLTLTFGYRF